MKILLDTHAFLWFVMDSPKISKRATSLIESTENEVYLSVASVWEMAIKVSIGKLRIDESFEDFIMPELESNQFSLLNIEVRHLGKVVNLPFHHRDPFDRLLAAQSLTMNMPILSRDTAFDLYDVERLW